MSSDKGSGEGICDGNQLDNYQCVRWCEYKVTWLQLCTHYLWRTIKEVCSLLIVNTVKHL